MPNVCYLGLPPSDYFLNPLVILNGLIGVINGVSPRHSTKMLIRES